MNCNAGIRTEAAPQMLRKSWYGPDPSGSWSPVRQRDARSLSRQELRDGRSVLAERCAVSATRVPAATGRPRRSPRRRPSSDQRIFHVLRSGCRWSDAPPSDRHHKTLYKRSVRRAGRGIWRRAFEAVARTGPRVEVLMDSTHVKAHSCPAGGRGGSRTQAIGRSQGGRTTKLHALSGGLGRPLRFLPTGGQAADFGRQKPSSSDCRDALWSWPTAPTTAMRSAT